MYDASGGRRVPAKCASEQGGSMMGCLLARAEMGPHTSDFTRCFHAAADWRLEAGTVLHMYASATGVSLSETVLVTADGTQRLTQKPWMLFGT
jgi:Xaa-Pro dipeptidase